jgi:acyl carrier protein
MSEQPIYLTLTQIFRDVLGREDLELNPQLTARDLPEWDSMAHVSIIVAVEMRFGVKFMTAELSTLSCVGDFVGLIGSKLAV